MKTLRSLWWALTDHTMRPQCDDICAAEGCDCRPWHMSRREALNIVWETSRLRRRTRWQMRCGCSRSMLTGRMALYTWDCDTHGLKRHFEDLDAGT